MNININIVELAQPPALPLLLPSVATVFSVLPHTLHLQNQALCTLIQVCFRAGHYSIIFKFLQSSLFLESSHWSSCLMLIYTSTLGPFSYLFSKSQDSQASCLLDSPEKTKHSQYLNKQWSLDLSYQSFPFRLTQGSTKKIHEDIFFKQNRPSSGFLLLVIQKSRSSLKWSFFPNGLFYTCNCLKVHKSLHFFIVSAAI